MTVTEAERAAPRDAVGGSLKSAMLGGLQPLNTANSEAEQDEFAWSPISHLVDAEWGYLTHVWLKLLPAPRTIISWLRRSGVSVDALTDPELPSFAEVAFDEQRPWFDFADELRSERLLVPSLIFVARDEFGAPLDLIAWSHQSARVASWLGRAALLGAEAIYAPRIADEYTSKDGEHRKSRAVIADHVLALRQPPRKRRPKPAPDRREASASELRERAPFDDAIPWGRPDR